jgi:hypothetical protein
MAEKARNLLARAREELPKLYTPWTRIPTVIGVVVIAGVVVWGAVTLVGAIFSGGNEAPKAAVSLRSVSDSWVPGQPSIAEAPGYAALAQRAGLQAHARDEARRQLIARIAAAKLAAKKQAQDKARQDYLRKRAEALRRYREAQRKAAIERRKQAIKAAEARRKYLKAKREYEKKRRVTPGTECNLPDVKQQYDCKNGKLPAGKAKGGSKSSGKSG